MRLNIFKNDLLGFKKAQATLELSLVLIATISLIIGLFRITLWFTDDMKRRQARYERSRRMAGSYRDNRFFSYIKEEGGGDFAPEYRERYLSEEWIFKGQAPEEWPEEN